MYLYRIWSKVGIDSEVCGGCAQMKMICTRIAALYEVLKSVVSCGGNSKIFFASKWKLGNPRKSGRSRLAGLPCGMSPRTIITTEQVSQPMNLQKQ